MVSQRCLQRPHQRHLPALLSCRAAPCWQARQAHLQKHAAATAVGARWRLRLAASTAGAQNATAAVARAAGPSALAIHVGQLHTMRAAAAAAIAAASASAAAAPAAVRRALRMRRHVVPPAAAAAAAAAGTPACVQAPTQAACLAHRLSCSSILAAGLLEFAAGAVGAPVIQIELGKQNTQAKCCRAHLGRGRLGGCRLRGVGKQE